MSKRRLLHIAEFTVALLALVLFVVQGTWPFSQRKITQTLADHFHAQVIVGGFHAIYFPHPGCVLEAVTLRHPNDDPKQPFVTAQRLTIVGHYTDFLRRPHRLHLLTADGLRVNYSPQEQQTSQQNPLTPGKGKQLIVETFRTSNAVFTIKNVTFPVHSLEITEFGGAKPARFDLALATVVPHGELAARGSFGPLSNASIDADYTLTHADFAGVPGVSGAFVTKGHISGNLHSARAKGSFESPDFAVANAAHPVHLSADYDTTVDATSGDVKIHSTDLRFRHTLLHASGAIAHKTPDIHFDTTRARIEDFLYLFLHSQPAMTGAIALRARTVLPPGKQKFLARLQLSGDFRITNADFTHSDTQSKVNELSVRAQGDPDSPAPPDVTSSLSGEVTTRNGNAHLTNLEFQVPGAHAIGNGDYNLLNKNIDVRGRLLMDTHLSNATTGWKSVLLKPFNGLFKAKHHGSAIGISMIGVYPHPVFKTSLDPDRYKTQTIAQLHKRTAKPQPQSP